MGYRRVDAILWPAWDAGRARLGGTRRLGEGYAGNAVLLTAIKDIRKSRLTTFGRLMSDPDVRKRLGLQIKPEVAAHYTSLELEPAVAKLLSDLTSGTVTVAGLWSKEQRRKYVLGIGSDLPDEAKRIPDALPLVPPGAAPPTPKPKPAKKPPAAPAPKPLFDGVQLTNLGGRIADSRGVTEA